VVAQSTPELTREAVMAYQAGDLPTAIEKLRRARTLTPNDPTVKLYLGLILYQQDTKSREAQHLLESVIDRFLDNSEVQIKLLDSYLQTSDNVNARLQLKRLQTLTSRDEKLGFQVVYLLVKYGINEEAHAELDRLSARKSGESTEREGELYFVRGLLAASEGRKEEALQNLQQADRRDFPPRHSYHMLMLADALYRVQELRLAWQAYEEYLKHFPTDLEARNRLGLVYYALGLLDPAQAAFEQVRNADARYPRVHYQLAEVLFLKNDLEEAEKSLDREIKNDPACGPCFAKMARIFYQRGDNQQTEKYLQKARELSPDWAETHLVSGLLANRNGQYDEAIKDLEIVVKNLPDFPTGHLQLSIAYARAGQAEKSKEHREIYNRLIQAQKDAVTAGMKDERKPR